MSEVEESLRRVIEAEAKARLLRARRAALYKQEMSAMDRTLGAAEAQARAANAAHQKVIDAEVAKRIDAVAEDDGITITSRVGGPGRGKTTTYHEPRIIPVPEPWWGLT